VTFPLNLYSINSILPHLSLICQNTCFDRGLHIFWFFFFLFFYPLKLVTGFANVTSFKLKIITLFSTSTISLNLFMEIILSLSHDTFIVILTIYSFLSYRISITHRNVITSILCVVFYYYYYYYYLFLFTGAYKISPVVLIFCSGA